jgi:hypothetical protein
VRLVLLYFGLLILLGLAGALRDGLPAAGIATALATQCILGGFVVGGLYLYAWLTARSTVYAITDRRVVIKLGLVLPTTVNIPFRLIEAAESRRFSDGTGQIALRLSREDRIGFFHLWPHVRPWRLRFPEPMLRGLNDVTGVAAFMQAAAGDAVEASPLEELATGDAPRDAQVRVRMAGPVVGVASAHGQN